MRCLLAFLLLLGTINVHPQTQDVAAGAQRPYGGARRGVAGVAIGSADGDSFAPSKGPFVINYRVADLPGLLEALRSEGCNVLDRTDDSEFGKFGWVIGPEGNKVELWQPPEGQ